MLGEHLNFVFFFYFRAAGDAYKVRSLSRLLHEVDPKKLLVGPAVGAW
jgi:hypothetical protein